ncbi:MAG: hypothetical protein GXO28_06620 [Methanopyri archaeon]|nr:hypothetical protein [Methanopyri archaeon]
MPIGKILEKFKRSGKDEAVSRIKAIKNEVLEASVDPMEVAQTIGAPSIDHVTEGGEGGGEEREERPERPPEEERPVTEEAPEGGEPSPEEYPSRITVVPVTAYPLYEPMRTVCALKTLSRRRARNVVETLSLVRIPLLLASHMGMGPEGSIYEIPPWNEDFKVATPYLKEGLKPLVEKAALRITPPENTGAGWKRMPELCSWGIDAVVADMVWKDAYVVFLTSGTTSAVYGVYLSTMYDCPVLDVSYLWRFSGKRPVWIDADGQKHVVHWLQLDLIEKLDPEYVVLLGCLDKRRAKRVTKLLSDELDSVGVQPWTIVTDDPKGLGEQVRRMLEEQMPLLEGEVREKVVVDTVFKKLVRDVEAAPLPVDVYNKAREAAFRPFKVEVELK